MVDDLHKIRPYLYGSIQHYIHELGLFRLHQERFELKQISLCAVVSIQSQPNNGNYFITL